jgi:hypothetical protein
MQDTAKKQKRAGKSSVPPRSPEGTPRVAMQAGKSPEPENKHAKRSATKRRLTKDDR